MRRARDAAIGRDGLIRAGNLLMRAYDCERDGGPAS
jgi:hypothetical protein